MIVTDMSTADGSETLRRLSRKIIDRTLKDLATADAPGIEQLSAYLNDPLFEQHQRYSGYPNELISCMREMVLVSTAERCVMVQEVRQLLRTFRNPKKKAPD